MRLFIASITGSDLAAGSAVSLVEKEVHGRVGLGASERRGMLGVRLS